MVVSTMIGPVTHILEHAVTSTRMFRVSRHRRLASRFEMRLRFPRTPIHPKHLNSHGSLHLIHDKLSLQIYPTSLRRISMHFPSIRNRAFYRTKAGKSEPGLEATGQRMPCGRRARKVVFEAPRPRNSLRHRWNSLKEFFLSPFLPGVWFPTWASRCGRGAWL